MAVGQRFINKVMEEVLTKFQPGILPHYFVMQTFANLSVSNGELAPGRAGGGGGSGGAAEARPGLRASSVTPAPSSSAAGPLRGVVRTKTELLGIFTA